MTSRSKAVATLVLRIGKTNVLIAVFGIIFGALLLWFALRGIKLDDISAVVSRINPSFLVLGILTYWLSIMVRCLRWWSLLRAIAPVKFRHAVEVMIVGFGSNFLLPARLGEVLRADYAGRLFKMSRFTAAGTIVVERVADGVIIVAVLWACVLLLLHGASDKSEALAWITRAGWLATLLFGLMLAAIIFSLRVSLGRFIRLEAVLVRWNKLLAGFSSISSSTAALVVGCSLLVYALDLLAVGYLIRSFDAQLSLPQTALLLSVASLSTLIPSAPGYLGSYQFVFAHVFALFGLAELTGIVCASAIQIFFFGSVTVFAAALFLLRGGVIAYRAKPELSKLQS